MPEETQTQAAAQGQAEQGEIQKHGGMAENAERNSVPRHGTVSDML